MMDEEHENENESAEDFVDEAMEGGKPSIADALVALCDAELFVGAPPECAAYGDIQVNGHRETHRIQSKPFRDYLRVKYFRRTGKSCNAEALKQAVDTISMMAVHGRNEEEKPKTRKVHLRIAALDGAIYIDLGTPDWKAVEVTAEGWKVIDEPPVRFERFATIGELPTPQRGGDLSLLRPFINATDDEFVLIVAFALAALRPDSNYPVLVITGEQGSAKSTMVGLLQRLIDPCHPEKRSLPRCEDDMITSAKHTHLLCYDNASGLSDWMSDTICRLATGGGAGKRKLFSDDDEIVFEGKRPVIINGIEEVATRPDLVDRAIMIVLRFIPPDKCRDEEEFKAAFEKVAPRIFGSLLDGLATGLDQIDSVKMADKPRMADFAKWGEACGRKFWPQGRFIEAYRANIGAAVETVLSASPVGDAVRRFMGTRMHWTGTATKLLDELTDIVGEAGAKERSWPRRPNTLSGKLRRAAAPLRRQGIHIDLGERTDQERHITITRLPAPDNACKTSSASSGSSLHDGHDDHDDNLQPSSGGNGSGGDRVW
jgi:hypothetical protein